MSRLLSLYLRRRYSGERALQCLTSQPASDPPPPVESTAMRTATATAPCKLKRRYDHLPHGDTVEAEENLPHCEMHFHIGLPIRAWNGSIFSVRCNRNTWATLMVKELMG